MTFRPLLVVPLAFLLTLPACGDGGGGDGDGDGDGDSSTGGDASGGGTGNSGGSPNGSGGDTGDFEASGSIEVDFNGTPVHFNVSIAQFFDGAQQIDAVGDSTNSETVDVITLSIRGAALGEHDCTDGRFGGIIVGADNAEGEADSFEAQGASYCTITVTEHGGPGQPLRGTFSAEVETFLGETATLANGTFDIIEGSP